MSILPATITVISAHNGTAITRTLARDPCRREWVTGITNAVNGIAVKAYALTRDPGGRVTARNGESYAYNGRGELAAAVYPDTTYAYTYDSIGNSESASLDNAATAYTANSLNQYTSILPPGAADPEEPAYDEDGNLTAFGGLAFEWDARNRLVYAEGGGIDLYGLYECGYDVQGRLVFKDAPHGGDYLWDGWRMVKKQAWPWGDFGETVEYVWGKDLSGTMDGAGGVGGLLAVRVDGAWHFPLYDHNGNIVAYVDSTGAVSAEYEYDPFGKVIAHTGRDFDFLFSTKFYDPDIGMYYYGHRYYSPELRRWASPDPIGEEGGLNLYGFCGNDGVNGVDKLGLKITVIGTGGRCGCESATYVELYLNAITGTAIYRALIERIREPFKTAIDTHFKSMTFYCKTNKECSDCIDETGDRRLGFSFPGVFQKIQYKFKPLVNSGFIDTISVDEKEQWTPSATLCTDQLKDKTIKQLLKTAIHETAHCVGWGNHYIDKEDPTFNNLLPNLDKHSNYGRWGIPTGNDP